MTNDIYYLNSNKQSSTNGGNYEVHKSTCSYCKVNLHKENYILLGMFSSPKEAVTYAKKKYSKYANEIDGCYYCCKSANNG